MQTFTACAVARLAQGQVDRNLPFAIVQELAAMRVVGQPEPSDKRQQTRRHAFDNEQNLPGRERPSGLGNAVCQCTAVGVCSRAPGQEDARPQAESLARVEEGQVQWHARAEAALKDGQEHSTHHDAGPARARRL